MNECPNCEFPLKAMGLQDCPKCDESVSSAPIRRNSSKVLEIDIAHSGETWERAKEKLDKAIDQALYHRYAALKVIHGWGSRTGGRAVIGPRAKSYLRHIAEEYGGRFAQDQYTEGASVVWFNK